MHIHKKTPWRKLDEKLWVKNCETCGSYWVKFSRFGAVYIQKGNK